MSNQAGESPAQDSSEGKTAPGRMRRGGLWLLFAAVLAIPKTLSLRRNPRAWNFLRAAAGLGGMAAGMIGWEGHERPVAIAGGALLVVALAIGPERRKISADQRARELGALVVVDGGRYRMPDGAMQEAGLFVAPERLWVLDPALRTLIEIPLARVTRVAMDGADEGCKLSIAWDRSVAEFFYTGPFAGHLAQVAESTLQSQIRRGLPILP